MTRERMLEQITKYIATMPDEELSCVNNMVVMLCCDSETHKRALEVGRELGRDIEAAVGDYP